MTSAKNTIMMTERVMMKLTEFLIEIAKPLLTPVLFPTISFLLLAVLAFVTGSN